MDDFRKLIHDARAGSEEAFAELVKNYVQPLQRALRRVLGRSRPLRSLYDTVEFTQFAWQEFFRRRGISGSTPRCAQHGHRAARRRR